VDLDGPGGRRRPALGGLPRPDSVLARAVQPAPEPPLPAPSPRRQEGQERAAGARPPRRRVHVCVVIYPASLRLCTARKVLDEIHVAKNWSGSCIGHVLQWDHEAYDLI
jgi:hypothetical protein